MAVDGSDHADKAFERAIFLAQNFNSELEIITVIHDSKFSLDSSKSSNSTESLKARGEELLEKYKQRAIDCNLRAQSLLKIGDPAQKIIETAEKNNSELIIVGSRGLGLFKDLLVGSVSHKVSQHAKCPVMMVR